MKDVGKCLEKKKKSLFLILKIIIIVLKKTYPKDAVSIQNMLSNDISHYLVY